MSLTMPEPLGIDTSLPADELSLSAPSFEATLPVATFDNFQEALDDGGIKPGGFQEALTGKANGDLRGQIVNEARKYLGMMYKWGGSNPRTSFDCSGLVQY